MKLCIYFAVHVILMIIESEAGIKSTWHECGCSWEPWRSWSSCTRSCGGGRRQRDREVRVYDKCGHFTDCATNDMGFDFSSCNNVCYNGGTYSIYSCSCRDGWYGSCCQNEIDCGDPGSIQHGQKHGTNYKYAQTVTYTCDKDFNVTHGSTKIKCLSSGYRGYWSDSKPTCTFVNTCQSNPCQNGGTCINGYERYDCQCPSGFSGVNCENDVQPPLVENCSKDKFVYSHLPITKISWPTPNFTDPLGNNVKVTSNYQQNEYDFPWGDFTVQYTALKPSNGLRTECTFNITVRPHQCKALNIPANGYKVCTGWKKDYGLFCLQYCAENYTVERQYDLRQWYVCGTRGQWTTPGFMPNCTDPSMIQNSQFSIPFGEGKVDIQDKFLTSFKSSKFKYFCERFPTECVPENVNVAFNI
ncbi:hypothetical protein FSP39_022139 [Pinctada imbricata]|uniref:Uncharacterized protein n=1 Tax=Pinctada imbricata TaxID=66713 RepID=A0AA89BL90_PINIB|nr:hypothetical protein FSP39_022139 [Pinctada imbricata]